MEEQMQTSFQACICFTFAAGRKEYFTHAIQVWDSLALPEGWEATGWEAVGWEAAGWEAVGWEAAGWEGVGWEAVGGEAAGGEAAGEEAVSWEVDGEEGLEEAEGVGVEAEDT